jgi:hypothetical protein
MMDAMTFMLVQVWFEDVEYIMHDVHGWHVCSGSNIYYYDK